MRSWIALFPVISCAAEPTADLSDAGTHADAASLTDAGDIVDAAGSDPWADVMEAIEADALNDLTVRVGSSDGVLFTYSKGTSAPESAYLIASASKWLGSAVFMSLVEEGLLSLDDHPQEHLPFWTNDPTDPRSRITLAHLLSFTSGLPRDEPCPMLTTTECAQRIYDAGAGVTAEPGTTFAYGGSHMQVAGAMAVAVSGGTNFGALFRRYVGDPLGMAPEAGYRPNPNIAGGASMSVEDYTKFVEAIFNRRLVPESLDAMAADHTPNESVSIVYSPIESSGLEWHYGLGQWRECYDVPWSAACDRDVRISSPGAFGFYPLIDRSATVPYWLIIGREDRGAMAAGASVELGARLTPIIEAALGIE